MRRPILIASAFIFAFSTVVQAATYGPHLPLFQWEDNRFGLGKIDILNPEGNKSICFIQDDICLKIAPRLDGDGREIDINDVDFSYEMQTCSPEVMLPFINKKTGGALTQKALQGYVDFTHFYRDLLVKTNGPESYPHAVYQPCVKIELYDENRNMMARRIFGVMCVGPENAEKLDSCTFIMETLREYYHDSDAK